MAGAMASRENLKRRLSSLDPDERKKIIDRIRAKRAWQATEEGTEILAAEPAADTKAYNYEVEISGDVQADNPLMATMLGLPSEVSFDASATGEVTVVTDALEQAVGENIVADLPLVSSIMGLTPQDTLADLSSWIDDAIAQINLNVEDATGDAILEIAQAEDGEYSITFPGVDAIADISDDVEIPAIEDITLEDGVAALGNLLEIELTEGNGTVTAGTDITGFDLDFSNPTKSLEVNVADPDVLSKGIDTGVAIALSGELSVNMLLSEIDASMELLGIEMPPILSLGMSLLDAMGIDEIPLGSGSFELQATIEPVSDPVVVV